MRPFVFRSVRTVSICLVGGLLASSLTGSPIESNTPDQQAKHYKISLTTSSTTAIDDKRIAAYFSRNESTGREARICTAENIAENLWITARHCSPKIGDTIGRPGKNKLSVEKVYLATESDDIALVKVSPGLDAKPFDLPTESPNEGDELTLVGYGAKHDYASAATNRDCYNSSGGLGWATLLTPKRVDWIKSIIDEVGKSDQGFTSLSQEISASLSFSLS